MTPYNICVSITMPIPPARFALLATLIGVCGCYIPSVRGWEAFDPFLLCGFAMLGVLVSGPMSLEPGVALRKAIGFGAALSLLVLSATIATVNYTVNPPRLLLPATASLIRAAAVGVAAPAAFAILGRILRARAARLTAAIGLRVGMLAAAWAWWTLPAESVLARFSVAMPVLAILLAGAHIGFPGTSQGRDRDFPASVTGR